MNRKEQNKLLLLLFLIFLTMLLFSTTSYAWFSANRMITIDTLNVQVATVGGIDISADGINFKNSLATDELIEVKTTTYRSNTNQIPTVLQPVSTGGDIDNTNGFLKMYYGNTTNDILGTNFILTATRNIEEFGYGVLSHGNYIAFDFFVRTSTDKDLYLTTASGVTFGGDETYGIENAFRLAFLNEGTTPTESDVTTIQGLRGATTSYIWEPNYDTHTESGTNNAREIYGIDVNETNAPKLDYDGIISEIIMDDNILLQDASATNHPSKFRRVNVSYATPTNRTNFQQVFAAPAGITKFRVYVWIEGQDVDCENDASVGNANLFLQLTTNPA